MIVKLYFANINKIFILQKIFLIKLSTSIIIIELNKIASQLLF